MNIFYQYTNVNKLPPTKGDLINEINFIKVLDEFATVNYNGKQSGQDIYFVRSNAELFLKLPHPKIWMAAPFDRKCYEQADLIATFTEEWAKRIRAGNNFSWIEPQDRIPFPKAVNIYQAVDDDFKPLRDHELTQKIRKQAGGGFIIGHFGRIVKGSYPAAFLRILPTLKKSGVKFICASTPQQKNFVNGVRESRVYKKLIKKYKVYIGWKSNVSDNYEFSYNEMPYAVSACDLICIYGQAWQGDWDVCGSRGLLEAAACGVPIICGDSPARREFFGNNYPLFHSGFNKGGDNVVSERYFKSMSNLADANELYKLIMTVVNGGDSFRKQIGDDLVKRANKLKPRNLSKRIKPIFEKLIK